tara:strand:+ start:291 stop:572 length:282 start_codon:yes stop_codon:yes gene_type:complete
MKRVVRNYIVRDSSELIQGLSKYETIKFSPTEDKQTLFESLIPVIITQLDKTELYVNGVRYNNNIDYIIEAYNLTWNNPYPLSPKDNLVFVYR